jgi:Kdo2-lipid IVA lauroyltransferase/acyltransferase
VTGKRVKHLLEYAVFGLLSGIVQLLPLKSVHRLADALGDFTYRMLGSRRAITLDNLAKGLPELSPERHVEIARGVFRSIARAFLELTWMPRFSAQQLREFAPVEDADIIPDALGKKRGLIFLTAHFGNWELGGQTVIIHAGAPILIVVKPQSNPYVDRAVNRRRMQYGARVVPMGESIRGVLKALEQGETVGLAADQSAAKQSVWVKFFGREVPVHQGPAVFALRTRAPIVLAFAVRQSDGTYQIKMELVKYDDLVDYTPENVEELTRRHVVQTEAMIRRYPEQWMWTHRRWKTGPEEKPVKATHAAS